MYYPSGCVDINNHLCNVCDTERGRVRSIAFIHKSYFATLMADIENLTNWIDGISLNKIFIHPQVNGSFDGGMPSYSRGYAYASETLDSYTFGIEFTDPNYEGNKAYWNFLRGSRNYFVAYCSETIMSVSTKTCTIVPTNKVDNDMKKEVTWSCSAKWTDLTMPTQHSIPDGLFVCGLPTLPSYLLLEDGSYLLQENNDRLNIMADNKISALPSAGALSGTKPLPIVQGGVTKKTTVQDVADLVVPTGVQSVTGTTIDNTDPQNPIVNVPTLLEVTTAGATSLYPITTAGISLQSGNESVDISTTGQIDVTPDTTSPTLKTTIQFDTPTGNNQYAIPDKGGATDTFAMLSDITGGGGGLLHAVASGTDTYTATISGVIAYNDGDSYLIRFTNGNTTTATLNINSIGAVTLYRNNDGALIGGDIIDGGEMLCIYNSTLGGFQLIGTSPNTLLAYVTNDDSVTLTKGMVVYAFGGTGDRMTVKRANNSSDSTSAQTVGLVLSTSIAANQKGIIIMQGLLDGLSILPTSTFSNGDTIYLGATAGTITNVKPVAPNHLVYLGVVTTASNGSAGRMYVKVQNGYELNEIHDVLITSVANNNVLQYESSTSLWKNKALTTASVAASTDKNYVTDAQLVVIGNTSGTNSGNETTSTIGTLINSATAATPNDTDLVATAESSVLKKITWTNVKAFLKTYFDTLYQAALGYTPANVSQSAYSMLANNTSGTANMAATTFKAIAKQTYSPAINPSWTGTTPPSGATQHSYSWQQVGNMVTCSITLFYATAGATLTQVAFSLPSDMPSPVKPDGISATSDVINFGSGQMSAGATISANAARTYLRIDSSSTSAFEISIVAASGNYKVATATFSYFTA